MEKTSNEREIIEKVEKIPDDIDVSKILNLNIGILGHVDSGKTSLSKKLSSIASTASFDKNPQSKERGITLDLGFSAFYLKTPLFLKEKHPNNIRLANSEYLQITLVDCPGHASLIKTVVAGANIIDLIVLVIDVIKGIQVQTTECLILGEILSENMVVALNKVDALEGSIEEKKKALKGKIEKLKIAFTQTKFGKDINIHPISANPSNFFLKFFILFKKIEIEEGNFSEQEEDYYRNLINNFIKAIIDTIDLSKNNEPIKKDFLFSIDHCFNIKNKGSIITGTILKGKISINDEIYFPSLSQKKIIKEIQMFKKPVTKAQQGDRVGMLIKNLDHTQIERSLACNEGYVKNLDGGLFLIKRIKFYKNEIKSNSKLFVIFGNQGVMAKCFFFNLVNKEKENYLVNNDSNNKKDENNNIDFDNNNIKILNQNKNNFMECNFNLKNFYNEEFNFSEILPQSEEMQFAILKFDSMIYIPPNTIALGSKIDFDVSHKSNRIAFYGKFIDKYEEGNLNRIKCFKNKSKTGKIIRMATDNIAVVVNLFKKDSNIDDFINKEVTILESNGKIKGNILSKFGNTGKIKIEFNEDIKNLKLKNEQDEEIDFNKFTIMIEFKKFVKIKK
jgi:selenocysteine-specific elongation factor